MTGISGQLGPHLSHTSATMEPAVKRRTNLGAFVTRVNIDAIVVPLPVSQRRPSHLPVPDPALKQPSGVQFICSDYVHTPFVRLASILPYTSHRPVCERTAHSIQLSHTFSVTK